jgi:hypothetical protein
MAKVLASHQEVRLDKQQQPHIIRFVGTASLLATLSLAFACSESPTETSLDGFAPSFANCAKHPEHPQCGGDPPPPPPGSEQVDLGIAFGDAEADALTSDGNAYEEAVDGVASHFSGANGNLMFDLRSSSRTVHIDVGDETLSFTGDAGTRIYTNSSPDLRSLDDPSTASARMFVEWTVGRDRYDLRFGTTCAGDKFNTGPEDDANTRVNIRRDGNTWTVSPVDEAYLCKRSGKGKNAKNDQNLVGAAFEMTMTKSN